MRQLVFILSVFCFIQAPLTIAQSDSPTVQQTAEYHLGDDCPVSASLASNNNTIWILVDNCFDFNFEVIPFDLESGTLNADGSIALTDFGDDAYVDFYTTPQAFVDDQTLELFFIDKESYDHGRFLIDVQSQSIETEADAGISALLREYTDYPEVAVFSLNHEQMAIVSETELVVFEIASGSVLFSMDVPENSYSTFPHFSPDGSLLYVAQLDEPDNYENYESSLQIYRLADGSLINELEIPSPFLYPSPNNQYVAIVLESILQVLDLNTGAISESITIWEEPFTVQVCANTGNSVSAFGYPSTGTLRLTQLTWLPDSSGFITVNSYGGEGSQGAGGSICTFNTSRLRTYSVN